MPKPLSPSRFDQLQQTMRRRFIRGCGECQIGYDVPTLEKFATWATEIALAERSRNGAPSVPPPAMEAELVALLELAAEGLTDRQIAVRTGLTVWQVAKRLKRVCAALGVRGEGRLAAVAQGYETGLLGAAARRARGAAEGVRS